MNEIIKVSYQNETPTVSGRELHKALEVSERYSKWFDRMCEYGFSVNADYTPYQMVHPQNHQEITDHQLTIQMAKEICMIQRTEKGKQFNEKLKLRRIIMKKILAVITSILIIGAMAVSFTGCEQQADRVSYNISKQADNFNVIRQITVINCIKGDVLFQMTGKMSLNVDSSENQLEITVEDEKGAYKKHFIGLSDNVTYTVEDVTDNYVDNYRYTLNFNPNMWLPVEVETID